MRIETKNNSHLVSPFYSLSDMLLEWSREVDGTNAAAVNLYQKNGFRERENPNRLSKNLFMVKEL
jgi:ribosomal protein S18 acetylase RimI-like enzyme